MGGLTVSGKILEKYFGYLKYMDNKAKKTLIKLLKDSMKKNLPDKNNPESLYGAWIDDRTSDEIILDVNNSRIEKKNTENFE